MRLLPALATLLLAAGFASAAWARAALVSVEPASGSMLASAPRGGVALQRDSDAGRDPADRRCGARDDTRISASGALVADFEQITLEDELDVTLQ